VPPPADVAAVTDEPFVALPVAGRTYTTRRRVRLADMAQDGRVRLDALVRYLQDVAIEDVQETGWGLPDHLWFIRRIRLAIAAPFVGDRTIAVTTWCSGLAAIAAGRRWSLEGDAGGRMEVDSVWIHLGPDARPARLEQFGVYAEAAAGRHVSTKLDLPAVPESAARVTWPLRSTDIDLHGHVNNAVYWQAVEHRVAAAGNELRRPLGARLDYGDPLSLEDAVELAEWTSGDRYDVAFLVDGRTKAFASLA
jgi:acyl-ACP thioesterase